LISASQKARVRLSFERGHDEALLQIEYAPINANDLLLIKGTFHYTPSLPTIVGNEGVGHVIAIGPDAC